jgi:acylphosphatase
MAAARLTRRYIVKGRVQGVGFRYFVEREATRLALTGWVRNLDDGSVETLAQGTAAQLSDFEGALWKGPRMSEVRGVETVEAAPEKHSGFHIRS